MPLPDQGTVKRRLREAVRVFRADVADQLRSIGGDVTDMGERLVLDLPDANGGAGLSVVVGFNEDHAARPGWSEWVELRFEMADRSTPLLALGWITPDDDAERLALFEKLTDRSLQPEARGLNAGEGGVRQEKEGLRRYTQGDVVKALRADIASMEGSDAIRGPSRALVRLAASDAKASSSPSLAFAIDANVATGGRASNRALSEGELRELLIAEIFEALQAELLQKEGALAAAGVLSSAKAGLLEALEWKVLGVAYVVDMLTSRGAMGSFMAGGSSWVYALVGPAIGALGSFATSKLDKAAALGLMLTWGVAVGLVTSSDKAILDRAQAWFPKGDEVQARELALKLAARDEADADKEVKRLEAKPDASPATMIAEARKRWQAKEIQASVKEENEKTAAELKAARERLREAARAVKVAEAVRDDALLKDDSRKEARRALLAIFALINFVGPYGISRVLEKWRRDYADAKASRAEAHQARAEVRLLRTSPSAQKARAMQVFQAAARRMQEEGVPAGLLGVVDGANVAGEAAERFDGSINAKDARRKKRLRLWGREGPEPG